MSKQQATLKNCIKLTNRKENEIKNNGVSKIKSSRKLHVRKRSTMGRRNRRNHVEGTNKAQQY